MTATLLGIAIIIVVVLIELAVVLLLLERWLLVLQRSSSAARSAEALLREFLSEAEYRQLCATGYLEVASPTQPDRVYRVPRGRGWVHMLEGGRASEHLCLQPQERDLPEADVVLIHKLLIQTDEEFYLRTANHFRDPVWWPVGTGQVGPGGCRVWP
jgi:hypothetical protein